MKLTTKDLEEICYAQSNRMKRLGLDVSMRYIRKGKAEFVSWNIHDQGNTKSSIANFSGSPDIATYQLVQWIALVALPEYL